MAVIFVIAADLKKKKIILFYLLGYSEWNKSWSVSFYFRPCILAKWQLLDTLIPLDLLKLMPCWRYVQSYEVFLHNSTVLCYVCKFWHVYIYIHFHEQVNDFKPDWWSSHEKWYFSTLIFKLASPILISSANSTWWNHSKNYSRRPFLKFFRKCVGLGLSSKQLQTSKIPITR